MALMPSPRDWKLARADIRNGLLARESWYLLGISDIRQRYKRSRLGQFWITISMGIFVGGIGFVYSYLFKQNTAEYLPFLAVNFIVWNLLSTILLESTATFTQATVFLTQEALPRSMFAMRILVRNLVAFGHNVIIIPIVFLLCDAPFSPIALLAIPGLFLFLIAAFFATLLLGIICTRFRDMTQILQNLVQMAFFLTPVMWRPEQLGSAWYVVVFNPFAAFLRVIADPLRGHVPINSVYYMVFAAIIFLAVVTFTVFARFRSRVVYWL